MKRHEAKRPPSRRIVAEQNRSLLGPTPADCESFFRCTVLQMAQN